MSLWGLSFHLVVSRVDFMIYFRSPYKKRILLIEHQKILNGGEIEDDRRLV
jgi:hypothetical protein